MNIIKIETRQEFRKWLTDNSAIEKECWVRVNRTKKELDCLKYLDALEEALCFGWIDSTIKKIDDETYQRFSKRRKKSNWTELNKERCRRLIKLGLMTKSGYEVLPDLQPELFKIDEEILQRIKEDPIIYQNFLNLPKLYVRIKIDNIQSYKHDKKLYENRLTKFLENTKQNKLYGSWNDDGRLLEY